MSACGGSDDHDDEPSGDIVAVATSANLTALLAAATKAGLADALADDSASLTVFAPTDSAFNTLATRLGFADATAMVTALPADALASILSYHVLPAKRSASQLSSGGATQATTYTFDGSAATLSVDATSGVRLTDAALTQASVTSADVAATNGVVHVIDKVLVPPGVLNVVQMAQTNPVFSSLVGAVVTTGLNTVLSGAGPFTVFAPTNTAFAAAPPNLSTAQLTTVLRYHVLDLNPAVLSSAIPFGQPITTVAGQTIRITAGTGGVIATIADTSAPPVPATITAVDVRASNGVIHVIDKVLIPAL